MVHQCRKRKTKRVDIRRRVGDDSFGGRCDVFVCACCARDECLRKLQRVAPLRAAGRRHVTLSAYWGQRGGGAATGGGSRSSSGCQTGVEAAVRDGGARLDCLSRR